MLIAVSELVARNPPSFNSSKIQAAKALSLIVPQ
jgi:hypothetical protein